MILRVAYLALIMVPFTLLFLPVQIVVTRFFPAHGGTLPRIFFRLLAFGLGLRVTLMGQPAKGPVLIAANHISWLDIPAIASQLDVRFVAKSDVANYPVVGLLARLSGTIFVDRTRRIDAGRTAREMGSALAQGGTVVLFAEGTSDIGTHVLPFRSALLGAARQAIDADNIRAVKIQPMAIAYRAISNLPLSRHERPQIAWVGDMGVGDNLWQILASGPKDVAIAFGEPLDGNGDRKAIATMSEDQVRAMLVALNRRTPLPSGVSSV